MKKFIAITILFLILLSGCIALKPTTIFKSSYASDEKELAIRDAYNYQWLMDVDSIPMEDWIFTQLETPCGYNIERSVILKPAPKQEILLILTTHVWIDTTFYEFEVLEFKKMLK